MPSSVGVLERSSIIIVLLFLLIRSYCGEFPEGKQLAYNRLYGYIIRVHMEAKTMHDPALLYRALADETRMKMLALIRRYGELCVCDVMTVLAITQSKASRHLRYLLNAGLLSDRRETVWIYYRIAENLDPARLAVVDSVFALLDKEQLDRMDQTIKAWFKTKRCGNKAISLSASSETAEVSQ
jgi:ArsR family transcriptional regulator, arsenate/arsenite/antimonite-responsive transcriptional repressor